MLCVRWVVLTIPPVLKLSHPCVSIKSSSSLAGGRKHHCVIDTLTLCSCLSRLIPHARPPSQVQNVFLWLAACVKSITHLLEAGLAPHKRDHSGFIIGLLDICLSPIDLWALPHDSQRFLSSLSQFFISACTTDSSLFIHKSSAAADSKFVSLRFGL